MMTPRQSHLEMLEQRVRVLEAKVSVLVSRVDVLSRDRVLDAPGMLSAQHIREANVRPAKRRGWGS